MRQHLLILGAGKDQEIAVKKATAISNLAVVAMDKDKDAPGFDHTDLCMNYSIKDIDTIKLTYSWFKHDAVIAPFSDAGLLSAGYLNTMFGLRGPSLLSMMTATNKRSFADLLKYSNASHPEIIDDLSETSFPVIIKPVDGVGSRGVYKIESFLQEPHPYDLVSKARSQSQTGDVIIQKYIEGTVFNLDMLLQNGELVYYLLHDELFDEGKNNFGVDTFVFPSIYSITYLEMRILRECLEVVKLLGITDGNVAVEGIVSGKKVYILEVNPRMSGGKHMEAHSLATGRDWITDGIMVLLGDTVRADRLKPKPHAWAMVGSEKAGIIKHIYGPNKGYTWHVKDIGDFVGEFNSIETSTDQTVVIVYVEGNDRDDVIRKIAEVKSSIEIEVV